MKLIEFDGQEFKLADEALLVRPIRELFYLWFMCDPRSTYMYLVDEDVRSKEIKLQEGFGADWEPSELLKEAMDVYRKQTVTTASILLESMRKGIEQLRKFFSEFDLFALDKNDRPIYQVSTMTAALKQVPELAKALVEAEKALAKDFATDDKARGTAEKALGEDL